MKIGGVGDKVVCIKDGADAPNPWHRANPLTLGALYTIMCVSDQMHASGTVMPTLYGVDNSGRLWGAEHFRPARFAGLDL